MEFKAIIDANMHREVITLGMRDYFDSVETLQQVIRYFREKGAHFTTMTQAASEHFEHNQALTPVH